MPHNLDDVLMQIGMCLGISFVLTAIVLLIGADWPHIAGNAPPRSTVRANPKRDAKEFAVILIVAILMVCALQKSGMQRDLEDRNPQVKMLAQH